ncbi:Alpha-galactosidase [Acidilobus saccharovorans 345-15]|uniref:Alpha-galactosidase n=1 Tax=Acidilobus saccharovorans (strain DSM 16705 / JCM 18335 / VKM B-2471 / 345-15) TaxID=666510 RepID=D9Q157_ACIS3|nr:Sip1-related alpha-galactosidase [Acidilobus saccharovorans]ADL19045.1 Alpha-galactosidase [Acidilobus saccharovorans 345-15]
MTLELRGLAVRGPSGEEACEGAGNRFRCPSAEVEVTDDGGSLFVSFTSLGQVDRSWPLSLSLSLRVSGGLALTNDPAPDSAYAVGFRYYNLLGTGATPSVERPPDDVEYPPREFRGGRPTSWLYPIWLRDEGSIPPLTAGLIAFTGDEWLAAVAISSGRLTGYLGPGPRLSVYLGSPAASASGHVLAYALSGDPYDAIAQAWARASGRAKVRLRSQKPRPSFSRRLGWCSWNAFLGNVTEADVKATVSSLIARGVRLGWALVDDGWESLEGKSLREFSADGSKFPGGLRGLSEELRSMGLRMGLWTTINGYWGSLSEGLAGRYPKAKVRDGHFVRPDSADRFYEDYLGWMASQGVSFVKVDNQVWLHDGYVDVPSAEAAGGVEEALQSVASRKGLELLMCMALVPEAYSNFSAAATARASVDYIPFWRAGAKLHIMFSAYAGTFLSPILYPDYDMFMSYDQGALAYAVAAAVSGGPVYITDRFPDRTNVDLLRRLTLPDGTLAVADEPGLVTRDVLLRDPYNEDVLLKVASAASGVPVVGAINVTRRGSRVREALRPSYLPRPPTAERLAYYKSVSGEAGVIGGSGSVNLELGELEAELLTLSPAVDGVAVIGIAELLVPPAGVTVEGNRVRARAPGTLVYYDGALREVKVSEGDVVEV